MRAQAVICLAVLAACGGSGGGGAVSPDDGPSVVVSEFMQAVADSNMARMASLWGTAAGSAAETRQPADYQRRIAVMYAYLRGTRGRVLADVERSGDRAVLQVEVSRSDCRKIIPFTLVRTGRGGWLITAIELGLMGSPGRPCASDQRPPGNG